MNPKRSKTLDELKEELRNANENFNCLVSEDGDKTAEVEDYANYMQRLLDEIKQAYRKENEVKDNDR